MQEELGAEGEGLLFPNDFVIMDEAHTMENVAAKQLGLHISQAGLRFDLARLYNPRSYKGLFSLAGRADAVKSCVKLHEQIDEFFASVEEAATFSPAGREFRVRRPGLVENTLHGALMEVTDHVRSISEGEDTAENVRTEIGEMGRRLGEV